jgi:hypothetical protein
MRFLYVKPEADALFGPKVFAFLSALLVACGSGGGAGPGGGGAGGNGVAGAGGSSGATGSAGESGATGSAGESGATGSAGASGATGSAGAAGAGAEGGTAGSGGGGGVAGSAGAGGGAGTRPPAIVVSLEYENSSSSDTAFKVRLTNAGPTTPDINSVHIRYYFLDDANHVATPTVVEAIWSVANSSKSIDLLPAGCPAIPNFALPPQSSYIDFFCYGRFTFNIGDIVTMSIAIAPAAQIASNDYSYADTGGAFMANDRLLLTVNGLVQSGTPPP